MKDLCNWDALMIRCTRILGVVEELKSLKLLKMSNLWAVN